MIVQQQCIDCNYVRPMYHNACRCYDCAMKRRKILDKNRAKNRIKPNKNK
jgi:hypothetical protein